MIDGMTDPHFQVERYGHLASMGSILDAELPDTLYRARELLQEMDNYQHIVDTYGYGRQRLQERLGLDDESIAALFQRQITVSVQCFYLLPPSSG